MKKWKVFEKTIGSLALPDEEVLVDIHRCSNSLEKIKKFREENTHNKYVFFELGRQIHVEPDGEKDTGHYTLMLPVHIEKPEYAELLSPETIQVLQNVMEKGERNGKTGWRDVPVNIHLSHAVDHIHEYCYCMDDSEPHLAHAFTRLMMAVAIVQECIKTETVPA